MENQLRGTALQSLHEGVGGTREEGVRGLAFMKIGPKKITTLGFMSN